MTPSGALLCFHVHVDVGYETPGGGFTTLLHVDLIAKFALSLAIDCPRGWLVASLAVSVDIQITTTCKGVACSIGGSAIDEVLQLTSRCKDMINGESYRGQSARLCPPEFQGLLPVPHQMERVGHVGQGSHITA
ncbi:uncharacterized protein LOC144588627 [Pogona vitticeps]